MELYEKLIKNPFFLVGPCVIEDEKILFQVGEEVARLKQKFNTEFVFKSSFDKANRTSIKSYRGPGLDEGLRLLEKVKSEFDLPIVTDIHESHQAKSIGDIADIIQIPAFLCRQTDLLVAAAQTNRIVNVKKAQFLSGKDMKYPVQKIIDSGNEKIILTERGNSVGYNNLAVDFRNIPDMKDIGVPVVMDCTHSVQRPGAGDGITTGNREFVINMALAAKAFGANGYFVETHPDPDKGLSDAANMLELSKLNDLVERVLNCM
ncbi:MAG: 3-deoxy-8-phosphooctulonate synthase [Marinifilaceae bacterium]|nr:3-deoxy-8-phosphooctulonate synthase [Marinifilaceae bacterium]